VNIGNLQVLWGIKYITWSRIAAHMSLPTAALLAAHSVDRSICSSVGAHQL
jgi:hypothetical protein